MDIDFKSLDAANALLNYDLDVSARKSRKVLAVLKRKTPTGQSEEFLTIVDLKTASLWMKIKLWWNNSLKKATIANFLDRHFEQWYLAAAYQQAVKFKFEKQCNKLFKKIPFKKNPSWNLRIEINVHDKETIIPFDRLTSNSSIYSQLEKITGSYDAPLLRIFEYHAFDGCYKGEQTGMFMKDSEMSGDRTLKIRLSNLMRDSLEYFHKKKIREDALAEGRVQGIMHGMMMRR